MLLDSILKEGKPADKEKRHLRYLERKTGIGYRGHYVTPTFERRSGTFSIRTGEKIEACAVHTYSPPFKRKLRLGMKRKN